MKKAGRLRQTFRIRLDVEKLAEYIAEKIVAEIGSEKCFDDVEYDEAVFEDYSYLLITGGYDTNYIHYWCNATLECPPEDEIDREFIGDVDWFLKGLPDEIKNCVSVNEVQEDEEKVEYYGGNEYDE